MSTPGEYLPLDADSLPLPSVSDRVRDESAPRFLARLRATYGDVEQFADVLGMLGVAR